MPHPDAPEEIVHLATQRAEARAASDWARADELRAAIESAGWRVVDAGTDYALAPARPADVASDDRILYGSPSTVPSRLAEPERPGATIVTMADTGAAVLGALLGTLRDTSPPGTGLLAVAGGRLDAALIPDGVEVIWTAVPFSPGAGLVAALRRVVSSVVIVVAADTNVLGDIVTPLTDALADEGVGIAGNEGLSSADLRRYHATDADEATAIGPGCYAFRRRDALSSARPDDRFHLPGSLAIWWSLTLRDQGEAAPPRRALVVPLPLEARSTPDPSTLPADEARLARRDAYRIAADFRDRPELASDAPPDA